MPLRVTSWNVNGIRNPFGYHPWRDKRTFDSMFDILEADIVVMQELKIQRKDLRDDMVLVPGWDCYFSLPKHKKGYSGVAIYTRQSACAPIRAEEGLLGVLCPPDSSTPYRDLPSDQSIGGYLTDEQIDKIGVDPVMLDAEGRCVVLEFPAFVIFGVYSPANSNGLRDDFRYGFLSALDTRIRNLAALGKRVILTGDLNVSRAEIDTARAEESMKKEGITHEEYISSPNRRIFNQLLEGGEVAGPRDEGREEPVLWDTCREFHPSRKGMFTHWEQKINARPANFGSRIDYVLCSITMKDWFSYANIQEGLMGSDHCPVYATMKDKVCIDDQEVDLRDIVNPPGMFEHGKKMRDYSIKDLLPFSGKLLPEFDKRRSIKDMFKRTPSLKSSASNNVDIQTGTISTQPDQPSLISGPHGASNVVGGPRGVPQDPCVQSSSPAQQVASNLQGRTSPEKKRPATSSSSPKVSKRSKPTLTTSVSKPPLKGQQSLKGFFKPNTANGQNKTIDSRQSQEGAQSASQSGSTSAEGDSESLDSATNAEEATGLDATKPVDASAAALDPVFQDKPLGTRSDFIDPIVSKESWSKLFTKRAPPRCEGHNEPCTSYTTKKPGINCGRAFWICPRPVGPTGNKEKNTEWRCHTFVWASDWNGGEPS